MVHVNGRRPFQTLRYIARISSSCLIFRLVEQPSVFTMLLMLLPNNTRHSSLIGKVEASSRLRHRLDPNTSHILRSLATLLFF